MRLLYKFKDTPYPAVVDKNDEPYDGPGYYGIVLREGGYLEDTKDIKKGYVFRFEKTGVLKEIPNNYTLKDCLEMYPEYFL